MKKIITLLFLGLTVAFVSCKDDETTPSQLRFKAPEVGDVSYTSAAVTCGAEFSAELLKAVDAGFAYGTEDQAEADFSVVADPTVTGNVLGCRLTGLKSSTTYRVYAYADLGSQRVVSETVSFTTLEIGDEPGLEITSELAMRVPATQGDYVITYVLHNPVEGEWPELAYLDKWINSFDDSEEGEITFHVDANPDASERTAKIQFYYAGELANSVYVIQAAAGSGGEDPAVTVALNPDLGGWPKSYPGSAATYKIDGHDYQLKNVANFQNDNGIQFKRSAGYLANLEDRGVIRSVEVVFKSNSNDKDMTLALGDTPVPSGDGLKAVGAGDTYVFDCSAYACRYFTLNSGDGANYVASIKINCGGGSVTPPDPVDEPAFGDPSFGDLTKNSATISCSYTYTGDKTVSDAYFLYKTSTGAEVRAGVADIRPGDKSAQLTGLTPSTRYSFRLCVAVDGKVYSGGTASFTTFDESGKPSENVRYTGWAELPVEDALKLDNEYYYAYHLCPDYPSSGTKARNFSTCYSKPYRCPVWVAAPLHDCYTGGVNRTNAYRSDPDIKCTQVGHWDGYTRGHMLGSNERRVTTNVNRDVFYYSNIGPQLQTYFNTGGGQWNTAEDWVDKQWRGLADTCYQVVGTYWENTSKVVDGTTIPTHYYIVLLKAKKSAGKKWVVDCSQSELQSIAILVRHKTYAKNEVVKAADFESKGVFKSVAEIERLTGHTFFPNVPNVPKNNYNPNDWNF